MLKIKDLHFVVLASLLGQNFVNAQNVALPKCKNSFIVIAHRGAHQETPENTLSAYQKAIDLGVDFVEIDLRTSKDNQLIIMHDATLERMTGVKKRIKDLSLDSLNLLKIRDLNHLEWGQHTIPTFKDVLALCKNKINIYLDFKDASVEQSYKEIVEAGMQENVIIYINSKDQFDDWRRISPNMPLIISLPKAIKTASEMNDLLTSMKVDILDGNYAEYTAETVKAALTKNVPIWADIQSRTEGPEQWEMATATGLTGLQTDHPKELIAFLVWKGLRK